MDARFVVLVAALPLLAGCTGGPSETGSLTQAGSSTVFPIAAAWAEELAAEGLRVTVAGGGSGAGASKLCAGEIDIADLSRHMGDKEKESCRANGIEPEEWIVAFDGLTLVVSTTNTFLTDISVEELAKLWAADSQVATWQDLRPSWPATPVKLYAPDSDSGTYEYFIEQTLGKKCGADGKSLCAPRTDYTPSADDNVLVEGVAASEGAFGYFGYAYFKENTARLKAVPVIAKGETTPVAPTLETIRDGSYKPFGRPVFMYTDGVPEPGTPLHRYFEYAFSEGQALTEAEGFVPLDDATLAAMRAKL